jgi:hypothetical protein
MDGVAAFLKIEEAIQGAVEAAGDGVFLAIEAVEESGIAGVGSECRRETGCGVGHGGVVLSGTHVAAESGGFDGPGALLAPF